jgi:hypothetical protein
VAGCFTHLFLRQEHTSFLIYVGDKTYSSIKTTNKRFIDALYPFQPEVKAVPLNRKHSYGYPVLYPWVTVLMR